MYIYACHVSLFAPLVVCDDRVSLVTSYDYNMSYSHQVRFI